MLLAFSDRLKKAIFEERVVTCTLMIAAQGLLPAFVRGWGLLKQCCVRNAIPTTEPKAILLFFFCADMHQFHSYDAPPSGLQATETFSQDCAPTLSLCEDGSR